MLMWGKSTKRLNLPQVVHLYRTIVSTVRYQQNISSYICCLTSGSSIVRASLYLLNVVESALHALNRMIPPILNILRFQHLRKSPFPFLRYQPVFSHLIWSSNCHADCKWMLIAIARIIASMNLKLVETGETQKVMRSLSKTILTQLTAGCWLLAAGCWLLGACWLAAFNKKRRNRRYNRIFRRYIRRGIKIPNYELRIICTIRERAGWSYYSTLMG